MQYSPAVEEEEESSRPCVECEVSRELLLNTYQLIPPLEFGYKRFEENELDSATILEQESDWMSRSWIGRGRVGLEDS